MPVPDCSLSVTSSVMTLPVYYHCESVDSVILSDGASLSTVTLSDSASLFTVPYQVTAISVLQDFENEQYQELARRLAPQYLVLDKEKDDAFPLYFEDMMTGDR